MSAEVEYCPECGSTVATDSGDQGPTPSEGAGDGHQANLEQPHEAGPAGQRQRGGTPARNGGLGSLPIVGGLVYGVVSYVLGLVLTFVLALGVTGSETPVDVYAADAGPYAIGWLFYSVHNVGIVFDLAGETQTMNLIEQAYTAAIDPGIPKIAFYLLPIVVLFVFGLVLARRTSYDGVPTEIDRAKAGASVAIGYLAMTVLGAVAIFSVSNTSQGATVSIQPQLGSAVIVMGLLYPIVAGGLAGYLVGN
mgnify:CR=1 FL=1